MVTQPTPGDFVAVGVATVGEATAFIVLTQQFLSGDDFGLSKFKQQGGLCILEIDLHSVKRLRPLVTMLLGRMPNWNYSRNWGYGPSGLLGVIIVVLIVLLLLGRLPL